LNNLDHIIKRCQRNEEQAQKQLYDLFYPTIFGVCKRYIKNEEDAKDIMIESFVKIFNKIIEFRFEGSFEGWVKRIAMTESLMHLRKHKIYFEDIDKSNVHNIDDESEEMDIDISYTQILSLFDKMPDGYRTVLNLYVVDGLKHKEIAEQLGISINTSKSQLILARKKMQELLKSNFGLTKDILNHG
jgi:RNA polymerase sigma factor (sigma-70 family)